MLQVSLSEYFAALRALQAGSLDAVAENTCYLPIRRFNPACLITERGRSVLDQLMKVAAAIIIEDPDVRPAHLIDHARQFGLRDLGITHCTGDAVRTEADYYVVARKVVAEQIPGEMAW